MVIYLLYNTEPGLNAPMQRSKACNPSLPPCYPTSCISCHIEKEIKLDKGSDCKDPNKCAEVTIQKIEPSIWVKQPPYTHPPSTCTFCFWKVN